MDCQSVSHHAVKEKELEMEHNVDKKFYFRIEGCVLENVSLNEIDLFLDKKYPVNTFLDNDYFRNKFEVELKVGEDYSSTIRTSDDLYFLPNFKSYYIKRTM